MVNTSYGKVLLSLVLAVSVFSSAWAGDTVTVKLKDKSLKDADCILTPGDLEARYQIIDGIVCPVTQGYTKKEKQIELSLAGTPVTLDLVAKEVVVDGKKVCGFSKKGKGCAPAEFEIADGRDYELAFPFASTRSSSIWLFCRSGFVQTGKLGSTKFHLYDDNLDGVFTTGSDMFGVDKLRVFAPISDVIVTPKDVYAVGELSEDGSQISFTKYSEALSKFGLKFDAKKMKGHFAFASEDGSVTFLSDGKKKIFDVPPGTYKMLCGLIFDKKKGAFAKVQPGENFEPIVVEEGKTTKSIVGKPFVLKFEVEKQANRKIKIDPSKLFLTGRRGEQYIGGKIIGKPIVALDVGKKKNLTLGMFGFG